MVFDLTKDQLNLLLMFLLTPLLMRMRVVRFCSLTSFMPAGIALVGQLGVNSGAASNVIYHNIMDDQNQALIGTMSG